MGNKGDIRVMAIASEGGHWVQLQRLRSMFDRYSTYYVSTNGDLGDAYNCSNFFTVKDCNFQTKFRMIICFLQVLILFVKIRPTHVITTGAAPGFFAVVVAKVFGIKSVWIDSIANSEELSKAGCYAGYFASLWFTQWPELSSEKGPMYIGKVL